MAVSGSRYDVFLSFRKEDTRVGFVGHLCKALNERGISTFFDNKLVRGEEITASLEKAIEGSRIFIVVFSENYASSKWCLEELDRILHSSMKNGQVVIPVFYHVDPSDVRLEKKGKYGEALAMHEQSTSQSDKVMKWRNALQQAANFSGFHFRHGDGYEYQWIEKIIDAVSNKICPFVLIGHQYQRLELYFSRGATIVGAHMIGIWGMAGIGKTTIARALYDSVATGFDTLCFLNEVRENAMKHGLVHLQKTLLAETVGEKDIHLSSVSEGISIIGHKLQKKRVLLVLDDVSESEQLKALVGSPDWFGSGSRIIITTRDRQFLKKHGVEKKYEVERLTDGEAFELLCWKAFRTNKVYPKFIDIINRAITYACGLPLALEVIGSNLHGRGTEECKYTLDLYEKNLDKDIIKVLKISFDALDQLEKEVFLDIACFFNGWELAKIENILSAAYDGYCLKPHIEALVEKSLIKINEHSCVIMHELIRDMGREIVRQESTALPFKRQRLWSDEDLVRVLEENTSSRKELATGMEALKKNKTSGTE